MKSGPGPGPGPGEKNGMKKEGKETYKKRRQRYQVARVIYEKDDVLNWLF